MELYCVFRTISIEKPFERLGFKVYFSLGITITGFSDNEEATTVNIFSSDLKDKWKNLLQKNNF